MPAARPSKSAVANVIAALREAGIEPGEVCVGPDGGFTVRPKTVDELPAAAPKMPRKWGQAG